MALSDTIATIVSRSKRVEICDTLHDVQNALTEEELIQAALPLWVYGYQAGVVDDALLASDFTEATLNANGIYTTGTFTIDDPENEVYIMRDAVVTINLNNSSNQKINVMGGGNLILVANDTSYATVKAYDASVLDITINDDAMVNLEIRDTSESTVVQNNNSVFHLISHSDSEVTHTGNDTSYALAKLFHHSSLTYTLNGTAQMDPTSFSSAQIVLT